MDLCRNWEEYVAELFNFAVQRASPMSRAIYIWQQENWPHFCWNEAEVAYRLAKVRYQQGQLIGRLSVLGFDLRGNAILEAMTQDVCSSAAIEGVMLDDGVVRSSVARHLGIATEGLPQPTHYVDGIVDVLIDAVTHADRLLTCERMFAWHAALFPTGKSGMLPIEVGSWRSSTQPMQVVSGAMGHEKVHYEAPPAVEVPAMMNELINYVNETTDTDLIIKAAVAHLWMVSIHPFDDGNGRIARTLIDMLITRSDGLPHRYYSLSAAIMADRKTYYNVLEATQHGNLDITEWLIWFLKLTQVAIAVTDTTISRVIRKTHFFDTIDAESLNARQLKVVNRLFDGFQGNLTSSKYAKICHCSSDTALRDLQDLCTRGIAVRLGERRGTYYQLKHKDRTD